MIFSVILKHSFILSSPCTAKQAHKSDHLKDLVSNDAPTSDAENDGNSDVFNGGQSPRAGNIFPFLFCFKIENNKLRILKKRLS